MWFIHPAALSAKFVTLQYSTVKYSTVQHSGFGSGSGSGFGSVSGSFDESSSQHTVRRSFFSDLVLATHLALSSSTSKFGGLIDRDLSKIYFLPSTTDTA